MKSKNPQAFWLRWIGVASLHGLAFAAFWMLSVNFFQWQWAFIPTNLIAGISLALLQYWAMSPAMRPSAKRWILASFLGTALSVGLHAVVFFNILPNINNILISKILLLAPLFLPQAISQSWALGQRFKNAWVFGLSFCLPALIFVQDFSFTEMSQILVFEIVMALLRASLLGASLSYLQKFQSKESSSFNAAHERLELQEQEEEFITEEINTEQKLATTLRSNEL